MHTHTNTHNHTHTHTHNKRATLLSRVAYSARRRLSKQVDTHTKEALKTGTYKGGQASRRSTYTHHKGGCPHTHTKEALKTGSYRRGYAHTHT